MTPLMDTIYKGDLTTIAGRRNAWLDAMFVDHAILRFWWTNFRAVKPGRLYRSNHPTPGNLIAFVRRAGIGAVINLRGPTNNGSDALSRDMAARLGLEFYDMALESRGAPHRDRILRLADIFARMRAPGLIHCKSGADRAGLAAGLFILIEGGTTAEALAQLSLRYGHVKQAKAGILDEFFHTYAREGEAQGIPFLTWVREHYDEQGLRDRFRAGGLAEFLNATILRRE